MKSFIITTSMIAALGINSVNAQQTLGVPVANSTQSGIGLIRGWACDANEVEIVIDDETTIPAVYGNLRGDTESVCGDSNNGFEVLINWNLFSVGEHNIKALADGVEFADWSFNVASLGLGDFPKDISKTHVFANFPENGSLTTMSWSEVDQNFKMTSSIKEGVPEKFTQEWLEGRTLYNVFYGIGRKENGSDTETEVPVAYRYEFSADGVVEITPMINGGTAATRVDYTVFSDGALDLGHGGGNRLVACENGESYIKTHFTNGTDVDNVDLFFFNKADAEDAVKFLGGRIPECELN